MKRFAFVAAVLVLALLVTPAAAAASGQEDIVYTALGDSIAVGTGGTGSIGYTDLLEGHLDRMYSDVTFHEGAHDGMTSGMLRSCLNDPANPYWMLFTSATADADIITVSIGGNDLLQPLGVFLASHPECADPAYLEGLTPEAQAPLLAELNALLYPGVAGFADNWPYIIGRIRMVNPTAEVHVNTLYNPFRPGDGLFEIVDPYVAGINAVIAGGAASPYAGYEVIDVYSMFREYGNPRRPLVHSVASAYALHPTDLGYKHILNMHKDALAP